MKITGIESKTIADSRGRPTLETMVRTGDTVAVASVPSGKSTGSLEALELRDADGGVLTAIANVEGEIANLLTSRDYSSPDEIDEALIALDGTPNKSRLGANAILSVSIAVQRLFALTEGVPLWKAIEKRGGFSAKAPALYVNMLNGGAHADFKLPFQEYLLVVPGEPANSFERAQQAFLKLGEKLPNSAMGDEGGYAPSFPMVEQPFEILKAIADQFPGTFLALDAAATELRQDNGTYKLDTSYSANELLALYRLLVAKYGIGSIEDAFAEDELQNFAKLTSSNGNELIIIGDDLTVTNPIQIDLCEKARAINGVLIKPNQIGSVKEAIAAVQKTHALGWKTVCSHRSGETLDTFIADFAYGVGSFGIKAGGFAQKERLVKYERLLEIESEAKSRI